MRVSVCSDDKGRNLVMAEFMPSECVYDTERHATILPADCITLNYTDYYGTSTREETKRLVPEYLSIVRATGMQYSLFDGLIYPSS